MYESDDIEPERDDCIKYCVKRGMSKKKAVQTLDQYEYLGLDFPTELIVYSKILKYCR